MIWPGFGARSPYAAFTSIASVIVPGVIVFVTAGAASAGQASPRGSSTTAAAIPSTTSAGSTTDTTAAAAVDTLEFYLGKPDSIIAYRFSYDRTRAIRIRRSPCFGQLFIAGREDRRQLTAEQIRELQSLVRAARPVTEKPDNQFQACNDIPSIGLELYREGHAGCLTLYLSKCSDGGWLFKRRLFETGGRASTMVPQFKAFSARLFSPRER